MRTRAPLTVHAAAVHQHAVQLVEVAHAPVCAAGQVVVAVQVQHLGELVAVVELRWGGGG